MHVTALGREHPVTCQCFGVRIVFVLDQFLQAERLILLAPAVHIRLTDSAPPHLINITHLPPTTPGQSKQGITPLLFPEICRVRAGNPVFRSLPPDSKLFEGKPDSFETHLAPCQALLNTDFCGQSQRPTTRRFARAVRGLWCNRARNASHLAWSNCAWTVLGREDSCLRHSKPFCSKAWIALRTVCVAQPRLWAICDGRCSRLEASRI